MSTLLKPKCSGTGTVTPPAVAQESPPTIAREGEVPEGEVTDG